MLKFIIFALLVAAIWYAFNYRRPGNWPPRDDRGDDEGGGPVPPSHQIDLDSGEGPADPDTAPEPVNAGPDRKNAED